MKLSELLELIDRDTNICVQYKYTDLHQGKRIDYTPVPEVAERKVSAIWYSPIYNCIMIEV